MSWPLIIFGNIAEWLILYTFLVTLLERKYSKKVTALVYFVGMMLVLPLGWMILEYTLLRATVTNITAIFLIFLLFKDKWYSKIITFAMFMICLILAESVGMMLAKYVYGYESLNRMETSVQCFLWQATVHLLMLIFTIITYLCVKNKKIKPENKATQYFFLYIAVQCIMLFMLIMIIFEYKIVSAPVIITVWAVIVVSIFMGRMIYKTAKYAIVKAMETKYLQETAKLNDKHFKELKEQYSEYRRLKHDFKNHINILKQLSNEEEIKKYTDSVESKFGKMEAVSYCSNLTLDTLFAMKKAEGERKGIEVTYRICDMENVQISEFDLCTLFSNLLDNAIEGAEKTERKFVNLQITQKMERLVVTVENSGNEVDWSKKTTKKDTENHGLGIGIIRSIAEKYDGEYVCKYENSVFTGVVDLVIGK